MRRAIVSSFLLAFVLSMFGGATVLAVDPPDRENRPVPAGLEELRVDEPITDGTVGRPSTLDASLRSATGTRQVVVRLVEESVGEVAAAGGEPAAQRQALAEVRSQQDAFVASVRATVLGRLDVALNAVILEVDASQLAALAANPAVERISPVIDYELGLSETVPYIGATSVHDSGFDGTGVSVAVLDSGIDYTHEAFAQDIIFEDIAGSAFIEEIIWLYNQEITIGCSEDPKLYCPVASVNRDQMASFLDRALDLPETSTDFWSDDAGNVHEGAINRLAASGITIGCGGGRYCPGVAVTREQMASFLVRGFDLPPTTTDHFTDDNGRTTHEADINALAQSGITRGCGGTNYCPVASVLREQMAAFIFRSFGGHPTAYEQAYGENTGAPENKEAPEWPVANIVGGFDFVGEVWPLGRLAPDPDPIDCGGMPVEPEVEGLVLCDGGHGTHVADIIGGINGVAPGVDLHAVKVCSAVSTSCSGVALLLAMDYALDPNGDGLIDDAVDVINMSLGSPYGQAFDDDLSLAVEIAAAMGVLTVASAGNSSDKPYVTGTPAATPSALSVAQTAVPSAALQLLEIDAPPDIAGQRYPAVWQPWSQPLEERGAILQAQLQYGRGLPTTGPLGSPSHVANNSDGCQAFTPGSLTGLVVLVDRGTCGFSLKIANIAGGGGEAGIIGLINADLPFEGGLSDCPNGLCEEIPGFMISQANSNTIKAREPAPGVVVTLDPANFLPLVGTMTGSSSRGPTMLDNRIKPEIGAPGASISAEAGTDTGITPFGGTSGAAPMVTGSAALLIDAVSDDPRTPAEIKSLLMNYAETTIYNGAPQPPFNSPLATIQRIGAGEVRVDRSLAGRDFAAWDTLLGSGALSFGFLDVSDPEGVELTREVTVANYGLTPGTFTIEHSFRFANDAANGAVDVSHPEAVVVPPGGTATFEVTLAIDGATLRAWTANSGSRGNNPSFLNTLEYDGYITLSSATEEDLHLAWHVLPRLSGETTADSETFVAEDPELGGGETVTLTNNGVGLTSIDGFSLLAESSQLPTGDEGANLPTIDLRSVGVQTYEDPGCDAGFILAFAVNTWERQTHANAPSAFEWDIDTSGDGEPDWAVFNLDFAGASLTDGRNAVYAQDLESGASTVFFFTDHATNSANTTLLICGEQIGLTAADMGVTELTADVLAVDQYFQGRVTDQVLGLRFIPGGERYFPVYDVGAGGTPSAFFTEIPPGGSEEVLIYDFGDAGTSEIGVLLFNDGFTITGGAHKPGAPPGFETIVLKPSGEPPPID